VKFEEAVVDYLSRVVGTLVGELQSAKVLNEEKAEAVIVTIQQGIDDIAEYYNYQKNSLDVETQV
jgi:hypothetical protein